MVTPQVWDWQQKINLLSLYVVTGRMTINTCEPKAIIIVLVTINSCEFVGNLHIYNISMFKGTELHNQDILLANEAARAYTVNVNWVWWMAGNFATRFKSANANSACCQCLLLRLSTQC